MLPFFGRGFISQTQAVGTVCSGSPQQSLFQETPYFISQKPIARAINMAIPRFIIIIIMGKPYNVKLNGAHSLCKRGSTFPKKNNDMIYIFQT